MFWPSVSLITIYEIYPLTDEYEEYFKCGYLSKISKQAYNIVCFDFINE